MPDNTNTVMVADESCRYALIYSVSDTNLGGYYLYDREKAKLREISKSREWQPPALTSKRTFITYKTRDGIEIPAWLTTPINSEAKNLPLVVNIHGGPWARGYSGMQWGRWPEAQFLASRGYPVLEPEPRGSTGFGRKHYTSSLKQWGLTMQDEWVYVCAVLDLFSRRIVGWAIADRMTRELVLNALRMANTARKPPPGLIFHSDRGSQYANHDVRA